MRCDRLPTTVLAAEAETEGCRRILKEGIFSVCKSVLERRLLAFQASFLGSPVDEDSELGDDAAGEIEGLEDAKGDMEEEEGLFRAWSCRSLVVDFTPLNFWARQVIASEKCTSHFRSI